MFVLLLVGAFLPPLDFFIVNVALPSIQRDLGASSSAEQLVISCYAALYAVTLTTGGRLGDLYGRGRMFLIGLIGFTVASVICGFAGSPWALVAGRALQGVTAAMMAPQALASAHAIFPEREKPLALGVYGAVFGLASVIGQALGGLLISLDLLGLGWRTIFLVNVPVAVLVVFLGVPLLKDTRAPHASRLDLGGVAFSIAALGALILPLIEGRQAGWPLWAWLSLAASPMLALILWRHEARLARAGGAPLLDPLVLRAPGLGRALLIALLFYAIGAFFLLFSVYLQGALHLTPLHAGVTFLPFGVGFLLGPLSTPFFRRIFGDYVNPIGLGLETLGFAGLACLVAVTHVGAAPAPALLSPVLCAIGFGQGLGLPTLMRMVTERVAPAFSGMIAGLVNSTLQVGAALSVAVIGGIFYSVLAPRHDPAAITQAFVVALLCIAACLGVGSALGLTLARPPASAASPKTRSQRGQP
ncbi:MFS transporter [Phenylobacterium sp.]|uniref:MFS transporter n=1 Tax=Phenylobacterium sp. TaxID=1871053 RepID=UPI0035B05C6D